MDTNIETNEEMIEDINEVETIKEETLDDTVVLEDISKIDDMEFKEDSTGENNSEVTDEAVEEYIKKSNKKKKTLLIVLLSILLVLDITALVIYIIGIDKVVGFIK